MRVRVAVVAALLAVVAAGCFSPTGSRASYLGGTVVVEAPPGAVSTLVVASATRLADPLGDPSLVAGTGVEFSIEEPAGGFLAPLTLTLSFELGEAPAGVPAGDLRIVRLVGGAWEMVPGSVVDEGASTVSASIDRLGTFAVGAAPVASIDLGADPVVLEIAEPFPTWSSPTVAADVRDAEGRPLGRSLTWSTGDDGIATVSGDGRLTAVAPGETTVEASAGSVSAARPVCVGGSLSGLGLTPPSGVRLPQNLRLQASVTAGCGQTGLPITYRWTCSSPNTQRCDPWLADRAADPSSPTAVLPVGSAEIFNVSVQACLGTWTCTGPVTREYTGAEET